MFVLGFFIRLRTVLTVLLVGFVLLGGLALLVVSRFALAVVLVARVAFLIRQAKR